MTTGTESSTAASSTTGATAPTSGTDAATTGPTTGGTTGAATPCGCPEGQVCVQSFDGLCSEFLARMCVDADGCVPGKPCTPACAEFCGDDDILSCDANHDCETQIAGAVHCYGI